jgi:hypothetical protein
VNEDEQITKIALLFHQSESINSIEPLCALQCVFRKCAFYAGKSVCTIQLIHRTFNAINCRKKEEKLN